MTEIEVEIESGDPYDRAYLQAWNNPGLRELVRLCYKTPDFSDNARRYSEGEEFHEALAWLRRCGAAPGPGVKVLDFGCGNGVAAWSLAKAGYEVLGIDSSPGKLAGLGAARRLQGWQGVRFELREQRGTTVDFPDAAFDAVWMREVFHHISDLKPFAKEMRRILRPGGVLLCMRDHVIWNESQRADFFASHPMHPITQDENCHYLDEYVGALGEAGFTVEVLDPLASPINTYPGPFVPGRIFDAKAARTRPKGNDLFTFVARVPSEKGKPSDAVPATESQILRRALTCMETGNFGEARGLLETACAGGLKTPAIRYARALAMLKLGQREAVREALVELLWDHSDFEAARKLLQDIDAGGAHGGPKA